MNNSLTVPAVWRERERDRRERTEDRDCVCVADSYTIDESSPLLFLHSPLDRGYENPREVL